ncbi:hypothetical protein BLNAU_1504 [Blattamonas nauphoetae]|uniref:Uncharacterized protein n=1 Tax=Blattamonas nauphoetae TaxID=2049346 RepID=A0ABQ9YI97_9EUKA|nr:hypothetical protein BLNAU_1504 [Blattamonas nauphoetae]
MSSLDVSSLIRNTITSSTRHPACRGGLLSRKEQNTYSSAIRADQTVAEGMAIHEDQEYLEVNLLKFPLKSNSKTERPLLAEGNEMKFTELILSEVLERGFVIDPRVQHFHYSTIV